MDLNEKIKQILADKNMSPSIFADEIGIQRSSMSHILAGRNKPSLDIVQKIIKRFPELGTNWILDGEELPTSSSEFLEDGQSSHLETPTADKSPAARDANLPLKPGVGNKNFNRTLPVSTNNSSDTRRIEKILIFYSDGTFEEVR
ncbi:helix-turn-helix transcriptional regulator [Dyadobacter sp. CY351]|uniref:helix-turn-helix transcriptional regulator n=1 Tax=Dyadobacter sp. CY351 TaxID=2909337 RepID=UPI001F299DEF|nr:helix-turn-helix transcriptional regulator [Dyadobacter sp. CY351]MCF2517283.1 helix-turn-helix domain-containing protein [Dyadobacter sp. CY351]